MDNTEEGGDDVKSSCPLRLGLQLVIPNQHVGVNAFPGLVHTARHAMGVGNTQSRCANRKEAAA